MADQAAQFETVLTDVIGLTIAKRNRVTVTEGITTVYNLIEQDEELIQSQLAKGNNALNLVQLNRLPAFHSWAINQVKTHARDDDIPTADFTAAVCHQYIMELRTAGKRKRETDDKTIASIDVQFNGKHQEWRMKKRELVAKLSNVMGAYPRAPLTYLIFDDPGVAAGEPELFQRCREAPTEGPIFEQDNLTLFNVLQVFTRNGTADHCVDAYQATRNGVQAWANLIATYEGTDAMISLERQGRKMIEKAFWEKDTRNFTFEDYFQKHLRGNEFMRLGGNERNETEKVTIFLKGITDAHKQIKQFVLTTAQSDLQEAVRQFKARLIDEGAISSRGSTSSFGSAGRGHNRQINGVQRYEQPSGTGRFRGRGGFRGSGRFSYRGGARGRGYMGRSNTSGRSNDDGLGLPNDLLSQLSRSQQAAYFRGRDMMRANDQVTNGQQTRNQGQSRSVLRSRVKLDS